MTAQKIESEAADDLDILSSIWIFPVMLKTLS